MIKNSTRYNRMVDSTHVPDIEGCDEIRFSIKTAENTFEPGLFRPVLPAYGMAFGAFPVGVMRINGYDGNANFPCLVFYKLPEMVESPRIMDVPVAFPNGHPHPNSIEVFNGNRRGGAFGFLNNLLGYHKVGIHGEPALLPGEFLQMVFCGSGSHSL